MDAQRTERWGYVTHQVIAVMVVDEDRSDNLSEPRVHDSIVL